MLFLLTSVKHRGIRRTLDIYGKDKKNVNYIYCANFFDVGYSEKRLSGVFSVLL